MSKDAPKPDADAAAKREAGRKLKPIGSKQKVWLLGAAVIAVLGLALMVVGAVTGPSGDDAAGTKSATDPSLVTGFAADSPGSGDATETSSEPSALQEWSPAIFRLGFSFFVGFAIAYALRTFMKISIVAIGLLLLALFGLQYAGVVDVDWTAMQQHFDTITAWISSQASSFKDFITGYLPSAASATGGLVVGFRKG